MKLSLEGWPTQSKEGPSPHEVRLTPLDNNPVFHCLEGMFVVLLLLMSLLFSLRMLQSLSVCYYHVTYEIQSESTLHSLPECQGTPCLKQASYLKFKACAYFSQFLKEQCVSWLFRTKYSEKKFNFQLFYLPTVSRTFILS